MPRKHAKIFQVKPSDIGHRLVVSIVHAFFGGPSAFAIPHCLLRRLIFHLQTLTDLNDFITPSQACIKPPEPVKLLEDLREPGAASASILLLCEAMGIITLCDYRLKSVLILTEHTTKSPMIDFRKTLWLMV
jgi:hypothetical protein